MLETFGCHSRKSAGATNNINDDSVTVKSPSEPVCTKVGQWDI